VSGSTTLKVKGSAYNIGGMPFTLGANSYLSDINYLQIFDSSDLVYPATEREAVFISTNLWITDNQTRSTCYPGNDKWYSGKYPASVSDAECNKLCVRGTLVNEADTTSGGVYTGAYTVKVNTSQQIGYCYCELYTW
jgi:hypothetical protein